MNNVEYWYSKLLLELAYILAVLHFCAFINLFSCDILKAPFPLSPVQNVHYWSGNILRWDTEEIQIWRKYIKYHYHYLPYCLWNKIVQIQSSCHSKEWNWYIDISFRNFLTHAKLVQLLPYLSCPINHLYCLKIHL